MNDSALNEAGNAISGNEKPEIGNDRTPHSVAMLNAQRNDGSNSQTKTANDWAAKINSTEISAIGQIPQFSGKLLQK